MDVNEQNFEQEILKFDGVAMVEFFATWCGPCKMMSPIVDELAEEMKDAKIKIVKIDIDKEAALAEKYDIMSVPTFVIFNGGEVKEELHGPQNKEILRKKIEALK